MRIIDKTGPLHNPADRDHCMQYMVAVPLIFGRLTADDYEDEVAARSAHRRAARRRCRSSRTRATPRDYLDADKRSIANAVQVFFKDGTLDRARRGRVSARPSPPAEGCGPLLREKFESAMTTRFDSKRATQIVKLFDDSAKLDAMEVDEFVSMIVE